MNVNFSIPLSRLVRVYVGEYYAGMRFRALGFHSEPGRTTACCIVGLLEDFCYLVSSEHAKVEVVPLYRTRFCSLTYLSFFIFPPLNMFQSFV